jgi:hypothetical protein
MDADVFRKTALGVAEIAARRAGLTRQARTALILVNGQLDGAALRLRLGFEPAPVLQDLNARGLVERVPLSPPSASPPTPLPTPRPKPVPAARPPQAPQTPQAPQAPQALDLDLALPAAQARSLRLLLPVFGPDATLMAHELLEAPTAAAFAQALARLQETLGVHMGRRRAAELARQIAGSE